jgi:hypothetical protein
LLSSVERREGGPLAPGVEGNCGCERYAGDSDPLPGGGVSMPWREDENHSIPKERPCSMEHGLRQSVPMPDSLERMERNEETHPKEATKRNLSSRGYAQDEDYVGNRPGGYTHLEGCSQTCWLSGDPRNVSLSNRSSRNQVFLWSH